MDAAALSLVAGTVVSLIFSFAPGIKTWYAGLESDVKAQVMAFVLLFVAVGISLVSCFNLIAVVPCTKDDLVSFFVKTYVSATLALAANQGTYGLTKNFTNKQ